MNSFFLGGIIQAFLLALYFLFNKTKKNKIAQRWLGTLLILIAITMALNYFLPFIYKQMPHLIRVWELIPFIFPVAIFFYILSLLYGTIHYSKTHFLLLIPLVIGLIVLFPFLSSGAEIKIQTYQLNKGKTEENFYLLFWLKSVFGLVMIVTSFYAVYRYNKEIKLIFVDNIVNQWIIYSLIAFTLLWFVGTSRVIFDFNIMASNIASALLIISIYILTFFTLRQTQVFNKVDLQVLEQIKTKNNQTTTSLKKEEAHSIYKNLSEIVEKDKLYLDKSLSLQNLTEICNCKPAVVSEVLNKHNNQNFYEFINEFRAKEVCRMLENNENTNLTIDAIGELAGFKSKSTFYKSFKKLTGQTPAQYKKAL